MKKNRIIAVLVVAMQFALLPLCANGQKDTSAKISFAGSGGYPLFNFMLEDGSVDGFDVDVAREISRRMGMELQYVTTSWDGIIEGLRAGRYDGILGSMGITEERQKIVDFSDPYYFSGPQLVVRKDSGISCIEDLGTNSAIAVVTGTTFENDARAAGVSVKLYEDDNQTLMELVNGRVDGVLTDRIVGLNAMEKMRGGEELSLAGPALRSESMGIAFRKGSPLTSRINIILNDMRSDGTMKKISNKWFPDHDVTVE